MAKDFDSLNVAAASAIALHHFARAGGRLAQPIIAPRVE
jgi:tRNA G18 (ribose-2'-O)-methylase SpoU